MVSIVSYYYHYHYYHSMLFWLRQELRVSVCLSVRLSVRLSVKFLVEAKSQEVARDTNLKLSMVVTHNKFS